MARRKSLPIYLTPDEIRAMLRAAKNQRDYTLVLLAYKTGLRCHELTSLRIEHLDLDGGLLTVVAGKGDKDRVVPLDPDTVQALRFYIGGRRKGILFLSGKRTEGPRKVKRTTYSYDADGNRTGVYDSREVELAPRQLNDATVQRIVREMARAAGVRKAKPITTHVLRHSFACNALLAGVPITTVQLALGHASLRTTEIYLKAIQTSEQLRKDFGEHPIPL